MESIGSQDLPLVAVVQEIPLLEQADQRMQGDSAYLAAGTAQPIQVAAHKLGFEDAALDNAACRDEVYKANIAVGEGRLGSSPARLMDL
jgi:hypothetical protein